jgi:thymidylate kinase
MIKDGLIVLTGIDGSGKTTQANLLIKNLEKDGIKAVYVWSRWEPLFLRPLIKIWKKKSRGSIDKQNNSFLNHREEKQKILNNPIFRGLWIWAFFIDYGLQIFYKVRIKLLRKKLIISDRIYFDSIIDQAVNLADRKDLLLDSINSLWMRIFFPRPCLVIYIDCPEEIALSRKKDTYGIDYLVDRRKLYLRLMEKYGWLKIDGTLPIEEIASEIKNKVYKQLGI